MEKTYIIIIVVVSFVCVFSLMLTGFFGYKHFFGSEEEETTTPPPVTNPPVEIKEENASVSLGEFGPRSDCIIERNRICENKMDLGEDWNECTRKIKDSCVKAGGSWNPNASIKTLMRGSYNSEYRKWESGGEIVPSQDFIMNKHDDNDCVYFYKTDGSMGNIIQSRRACLDQFKDDRTFGVGSLGKRDDIDLGDDGLVGFFDYARVGKNVRLHMQASNNDVNNYMTATGLGLHQALHLRDWKIENNGTPSSFKMRRVPS